MHNLSKSFDSAFMKISAKDTQVLAHGIVTCLTIMYGFERSIGRVTGLEVKDSAVTRAGRKRVSKPY